MVIRTVAEETGVKDVDKRRSTKRGKGKSDSGGEILRTENVDKGGGRQQPKTLPLVGTKVVKRGLIWCAAKTI